MSTLEDMALKCSELLLMGVASSSAIGRNVHQEASTDPVRQGAAKMERLKELGSF